MKAKHSILYSFLRMFFNLRACLMLLVAACGGARAATLVVTNTADSGPGTLRAALASATNGDTIDARGVLSAIILTGQLAVTNNVTIIGYSNGATQIRGSAAGRVFYIGSNTTVTLAGLYITDGAVNGNGAGIYNDNATLTVDHCSVSFNTCLVGNGAGIYNGGTLMVSASQFAANNASGNTFDSRWGWGGGIANLGTLTVTNCTFSGNSCGYGGGGIVNWGTLTVSASTLFNNYPASGGGGIDNSGSAALLSVSNSTFSGNSASGQGGAILNDNGTLMVFASTLSGNSAASGACIMNAGSLAQARIGNTILNGGVSGENVANSLGTLVSLGYNLSSDAAGGDDHSNGPGGLLNGTADIRNTDPILGPLGNLGGLTLTHPLLPGSPAIDHGKSFSLTSDQRGLPRAVDDPLIANATGGDGSDIGACEVQTHQACPFALMGLKQIGSGNDLWVSYTTVLGSNYLVQTRPNLGSGTWTTLPSTNVGTGVAIQSIVTNALSAPQGFYRIQQLP